MRLWHVDLIDVLPRQQLQGQWRELGAIYKLGTRHILINFVYEDEESLIQYSLIVIKECLRRGIRINYSAFEEIYGVDVINSVKSSPSWVFVGVMNNRYLRQCYYNLEEKYDRGGITEEEFAKISMKVKNII